MYKGSKLLFPGISIVAISLLSSGITFAATHKIYKGESCTKCQPTLNDGFYVGASGGYESYQMRSNNTLTAAGITTLNYRVSNNSTGAVGGIFAGYGQNIRGKFHLSGEVFVNSSGASNSQIFTVAPVGLASLNATARQSVGTSYGFMVLPGFKTNPSTLAYLRLGYSRAYIKQQISAGGLTVNNNNWSNGFAFGVGMETALCHNWSLRGDFTHVNYNTITSNAGSAALGVTASSTLTPYDNQFLLGLAYHIG